MEHFEETYNKVLKTIFSATNPIKKTLIKTQCEVHKFINIYALRILKNDKYYSEYNFFDKYISDINEGAVWADQDYKSSNHFYNPFKKKGLYGRSDAMQLGIDYYYNALALWNVGDINQSMFYLGASLHIIQDMTVPQHANIRLLDNHRQYENYIKLTYKQVEEYRVTKGTYILDSIEDYIRFNTRVAIRIYKHYKKISNDEDRFNKIAKCGLPLSQRTTAGAMVTFYSDMFNNES
ncbi:MAG: zinc dependent phospholipase C family protein [Tissierellaceae bacterium]|nr:zinc dependent phospholipase C family protein [Tissierellaceae bacterium]